MKFLRHTKKKRRDETTGRVGIGKITTLRQESLARDEVARICLETKEQAEQSEAADVC